MHFPLVLTMLSYILLLGFATLPCFGQSMVYSPSVNLPHRPLIEGESEIGIGGVVLVETRPHAARQRGSVGGEVLIRHGLSDKLSIGLKGWSDLESMVPGKRFRGGITAEAMVMLPPNKSLSMALMPRAALLFSNGSAEGGGIGISAVAWFPRRGIVASHFAIGMIAGLNLGPAGDNMGGWTLDPDMFHAEWGYGAIGNLGVSIELVQRFTLYLELAGIVQVNVYEYTTNALFSPNAGIAWTF